MIFLRNTGKLCFARLREGDGTELQVMLSPGRRRRGVGSRRSRRWSTSATCSRSRGEVVTSRRGELSVQATAWTMAAKALRPLPNEHRPLSDEARVRLRYVDMIVRPEARDMVRTKAAVLRSPAGHPRRPGATSRSRRRSSSSPTAALPPARSAPTSTRFDQEMLLRIALELDLKKAMIGGVDRVYEIGRTFRNEGLDSTHAAEFSMLEAYRAYGDYDTMKALLRDLVLGAAEATGRTVVTARDGSEIDLEAALARGHGARSGVRRRSARK